MFDRLTRTLLQPAVRPLLALAVVAAVGLAAAPGALQAGKGGTPAAPAATGLAAVVVDEGGHRAVALSDKKELRVFDLVAGGMVGLVLDAKPKAVAADPVRGTALVAVEGGDNLRFVDLKRVLEFPERLDLKHAADVIGVDGERGVAAALAKDHSRIDLIDLERRAHLTAIDRPETLRDLAVDPHYGKAHAAGVDADGNGVVVTVDLTRHTVERVSPAPSNLRAIAVDGELGLALLAATERDRLYLFDLNAGAVVAEHTLNRPVAVAVQPAFHLAAVIADGGDSLAVLDLTTGVLTPDYAPLRKGAGVATSTRFNSAVVAADGERPEILRLPSPAAELYTLTPEWVLVGGPAFELSLTGARIVDGATARVGGADYPLTWLSAESATVALPAEAIAEVAPLPVQLLNPAPSAGPTRPLTLIVREPNPLPVLTALDPARIELQDPPEAALITAIGEGINAESQLFLGAHRLEVSGFTDTTLTATIPAELLAEPGTAPVTLFNPTPGGGTSEALTLTLESPNPKITALTPGEGTEGTQVVIAGRNFDALTPGNNRVLFGDRAAVVASASETELRVIVPFGAVTGPVKVITSSGEGSSDVDFTVLAAENFGLRVTPDRITLGPGGQADLLIQALGSGARDYTYAIALDVTGLPDGVTAHAAAAHLSVATPQRLTLIGGDTLPAGEHIVTITATGPGDGRTLTRFTTVTLTVLAAGTTSVSGRVLHAHDDTPFVGAVIELDGETTTTDAAGRYLFVNPKLTGDRVLIIDGHPGNTDQVEYPSRIAMPVMIVEGAANVALNSYLSPIDSNKFTEIVPGQAASVTNEEIPGFELRIPEGAVLWGWDGTPVDKVNVRIAANLDRLPIRPLPDGVKAGSVYLYYFFRPGGAEPTQPIPVSMRNDQGLLPGEKAVMWYYDESITPNPDSNQWRVMGMGTVSADGQSIVSDPGVGIPKFCCGASFFQRLVEFDEGKGGDGDGACKGNPVDLATGIGSVMEDHSLGVNSLAPVELSCNYQSNGNEPGPFGLGTYLNLDWRLIGTSGDAESFVLATPGGIRYTLVRGADGVLRGETGRAGALGVEVSVESRTATVRFKDGRRMEFVIGVSGEAFSNLPDAIIDPDGHRIAIDRYAVSRDPGKGRVLAVTDGAGNRYRFDYAAPQIVSAITDPIGRVQRFEYDDKWRLIRVTDFAGQTTEYTWGDGPVSGSGGAITYISGSGDGSGSISLGDPVTIDSSQWFALDRIVAKRDRRGQTTRYAYDADGRTVGEILPGGITWGFQYQVTAGTVTETTVTDPNGHQSTYRFNGQGYETLHRDPLGRETRREYDPRNNTLTGVTDPLGRKTRYTYDAKGNRTGIIDSALNTTVIAYDGLVNKPTQITDPLNRVTTLLYNHAGHLRELRNPAGETAHFTYTDAGQIATATDPAGRTVAFAYDDQGNLIRSTDPLGRSSHYSYDDANRLISESDPLGRTTRYEYDVLDRATAIIGPMGERTEIGYGPQGRVVTVRDAKGALIERNDYDVAGNLATRLDANGNAERFEYDPNGNLTRHIDAAGHATQYSYDPIDQLIERIDADGRITRYTYDLASRLSRVEDSHSGTTLYLYDELDRLTAEITPRGAVEYAYDKLGRVVRRTINGADPTDYSYDLAGRVTAVTYRGRSVTYSYDAAGQLIEKGLPNGMVQRYGYDGAGQLTTIQHIGSDGAEIDRIDYAYDPAGNRIQRNHAMGIKVEETPFTATYDAANRMLTYNGFALTYDATGNLTRKESAEGATDYTWNARGELIAIAGPNGHAAFEYDHQGRRISKTVNGVTTQYLYDGAQAIAELQGGVLGATYHTGLMIDEVLARYAGAGDRVLLTDALGSVIALADERGSVEGRVDYSPYGESRTAGEGSALGYTGREDDGAGLYYYRARYYDPQMKRFVSVDPIGLGGGVNVYGYVGGDPLLRTDPLGLWAFSFEGYWGYGGGFTIGQNPDDTWFSGFKVGVGAGVGAVYDPDGQAPDYDPCSRSKTSTAGGLFAQAGLGYLIGNIGVSGNAGVTTRDGGSGYGNVDYPNFQFGNGRRELRLSWSIGMEGFATTR